MAAPSAVPRTAPTPKPARIRSSVAAAARQKSPVPAKVARERATASGAGRISSFPTQRAVSSHTRNQKSRGSPTFCSFSLMFYASAPK